MMKPLRSLFVVVLVALLAGACGAGEGPVAAGPTYARTLAYSLTGDEVLTYHTEMKIGATTTFGEELRSLDPSMPSTMDMDMEMAMDMTYQIGDGPEPGSYRVAMTTDNIELTSGSVEMGGEKLDLGDLSQGELDAALSSQLPEFVYIIDEKGDVISVEVDGIALDVNSLLSGTGGTGFSEGQLFGPELPEGEVTVGDSWTTTFEQELGESVVVTEETHKIIRSENRNGYDTWVIRTESKTDAFTITWLDIVEMFEAMGGIDQIEGMEDMPASFQMAMRSSPSSSTMLTWLDPESGRAIATDVTGYGRMTMEMGGFPGMVGSFSMDMDMSMSMSMELVN